MKAASFPAIVPVSYDVDGRKRQTGGTDSV